jgi:hypothetical protein
MKKLIGMMLIASSCQAGTVATAVNDAGGLIVLTDEKCGRISDSFFVYSTNPKMNTISGCWKVDENFVHIFWDDGSSRAYEFGQWDMKKTKKTKKDAS